MKGVFVEAPIAIPHEPAANKIIAIRKALFLIIDLYG